MNGGKGQPTSVAYGSWRGGQCYMTLSFRPSDAQRAKYWMLRVSTSAYVPSASTLFVPAAINLTTP